MTSTNNNLGQILRTLSEQYIGKYAEVHGHLPKTEYDEQWRSPCEQGKADEESCYWQPTFINDLDATTIDHEQLTFTNVESALSIDLHPDIKNYFTCMFSADLDAVCQEGQLSLLFAWNLEDFQRLQENIIGHILMKQRLKQAETICR